MTSLSIQFDNLTELYTTDETRLLKHLIKTAGLDNSDHDKIQSIAKQYIKTLRADVNNIALIDKFLLEYDLSSREGLTLMRLAEALIRTPDFETSRLLIRDKLNDGDWSAHASQSDTIWVNQATSGLRFTKSWIKATGGIEATNLAARLGDRAMQLGVAQAMKIIGRHFVLGRNITEAVNNSRADIKQGFTHSYDMLGEAAYTQEDAEKYYQAYVRAINHLAEVTPQGQATEKNPGISIKLSALHPRYEYTKKELCVPDLANKTIELAKIAKSSNLGLTIDAEEAERLEVSLLIFERLLNAPELSNWDGLGIVVQSYQRRASQLISNLINASRAAERKIAIRLVKGAYWDMEIKRAQELGLASYPVFTRKENTDISYIACARLLLDAPDIVYPQFATHNALTAASIIYMTNGTQNFEFQRLHGMGTALHQNIMAQTGTSCRVYAPVGNHKDLLPYLVRRLLENGANSSFVNKQYDEDIPVAKIVEDPFKLAQQNRVAVHPKIPAPRDLFIGERLSALGLDITQSSVATHIETLPYEFKSYHVADHIKDKERKLLQVDVFNPANNQQSIGSYLQSSESDIDLAIKACLKSKWSHSFSPRQRASCLERLADLLEFNMDSLLQLCTLEAGKSYLDGVAEVREAVDFCRYYAQQCKLERIAHRAPLGIIACISPWNFPLAIFLGQITASLSVGNTVIAKPAEQTPLMAHKAVELLYSAGVPKDAVHLIMGDGAKLGSYLTAHNDISGVCFTGSTQTAKKIAQSLASTGRSTLPFIAETGGLNALIVDSTALIEQAVQDVIDSGFQSAGQRCSACRLVCVQDDIADDFIKMLSGAMKELTVGDPALLETDIGPVIDGLAQKNISEYISEMTTRFKTIGIANPFEQASNGYFIPPIAFEINTVSDLTKEIFGPVLHVVRFKNTELPKVLNQINALGFGLTMGLHSRVDSRFNWMEKNAKVGNLYINRNQIGAVVGVQPFGGEGLSGTGPVSYTHLTLPTKA